MAIEIKPSDLYYRYPRKKETREAPKFTGLPDPLPFDRNDLYEVIPMFEAVMDELESVDGAVLQRIEKILNDQVPAFIRSREEIYRCLVAMMQEEFGG
jgi:hypothetical protein